MASSPDFQVGSLGNRFARHIVEKEIPSRYRRVPEIEILCRGVNSRLQLLHDPVAGLQVTLNTSLDAMVDETVDADLKKKLEDNQKLRDQYVAVIRALIKQQSRKPLLERLVKSNTTLREIASLHEKLDAIYRTLGIPIDLAMRQWEDGCEQQRMVFLEQFSRTTDRMLGEGVRGDRKVKEAIMMLHTELLGNPKGELAQLKESVLTRVQNHFRLKGMDMFRWFISIEQLEFDDDAMSTEVEEVQGTYGSVKRGVWLRVVDGHAERQNVAVKTLFMETPDAADAHFLNHLCFWYGLPDHPNILKLYGGSHVSNPPYFVCEVAKNDIVTYLHTQQHMDQFWPMFIQVAEGLKFLHGEKIVHGGLKGNNILVSADGVPKLADFGFSRIRTLSVGLSTDNKALAAQSSAARWQPKEVLNQVGNETPLYASDVYSLGMCMIEVITGRHPFGYDEEDVEELEILTDDDVLDRILGGQSHWRPQGVTNEAWEFISQLCAVDHNLRPTLDVAIKTMHDFNRPVTVP